MSGLRGAVKAVDDSTVSCDTSTTSAPATFRIVKQRRSRCGEGRDPRDEPACITVYEKGAAEVVRRLDV